MNLRWVNVPISYKLACIGDALLLPLLFLGWYRRRGLDVVAVPHGEMANRPGLFCSAVIMLLAARAALKIEQAVRAPEAYRWDLERAFRWLVLLLVMALAIRLLG
jgi:hypothetical protein